MLNLLTTAGCASHVVGNAATVDASFSEPPQSIVRTTEARGCTVPQVTEPEGHVNTNVIRGEFARAGQFDWAVLCSKGGRSTIVLFWGGRASCPVEIHDPNADKYPPGAGNEWSHDRIITAVFEDDLRGWSEPPAHGVMKHQGIEDAMGSKRADVYYCKDGKWLIVALAGS